LSSTRSTHHPVADTLVGLFLVLDSPDHETYKTGEIVAAVGDCYLIQFDKVTKADDYPVPMELYTPAELSESCKNCGQKRASLFKSRADMERWVTWVETPEKPEGQAGKVVHLKKSRRHGDDGGPTEPPVA
jgi:hypothetical protein